MYGPLCHPHLLTLPHLTLIKRHSVLGQLKDVGLLSVDGECALARINKVDGAHEEVALRLIQQHLRRL
jgi:hypothetical protein